MTQRRVWYASYGSNLLADRFRYYVEGGAMPGRSVPHAGTRDPTPPTADKAWRIPHRLAFGGRSTRWDGGGVAYVESEAGSGQAVTRIWNVTVEQFEDIAAQENRMTPGEVTVDVDAVLAAGHVDVDGQAYSRILWCGHVDDLPVLTFTAPAVREPTAPGRAYLSVVGRGLLECGLSAEGAASYLLTSPGVAAGWTHHEIVTELS